MGSAASFFSPAFRDLRFYLAARFSSTLAIQVQTVAVGWQVYDITRNPYALGMIGLAQFVPLVLTMIPSGDLADRVDRRLMLLATYAVAGSAAALLLALSLTGVTQLWPFYLAAALFGFAAGLQGPAVQSFVPFLVPQEHLLRGIALSSSSLQTAVIAGPALGGFLYGLGTPLTYSVVLGLLVIAAVSMALIRAVHVKRPDEQLDAFHRATEGLRFVWRKPVLLGAITLDLFAVLFGGTTALLPIFARDILHIGSFGLGLLRSSPAVGAAIFALVLARWPMERSLGRNMFWAVALFGLATIGFGLSTNFWLSFAFLFALGAADEVSVVIRNTLVQISTPDHMRGRVSAVHMLFVGTSNQLGEFRAGTTAGLFGTIPAVVLGGIGTLIVTAAWMGLFPSLRKIDRFEDAKPT